MALTGAELVGVTGCLSSGAVRLSATECFVTTQAIADLAGGGGTALTVTDDDGTSIENVGTLHVPSGTLLGTTPNATLLTPLFVSDGTITVFNVTNITFVGATITDDGNGNVTVTITP